MHFKKTVLESIATQSLSSALSFTWILLLARNLSESETGAVLVALAASSTIILICGVGLQQSISVTASRYDEVATVTNGLLTTAIAGVVAGVMGFIIATAASVHDKLGVAPELCSLIVFAQLLFVYSLSIFRAIGKFRASNTFSILQPLILNIQLLTLVWLEQRLSPGIILTAFFSSLIVPLILCIFILWRSKLAMLSAIRITTINDLVAFGSKAQLGNFLKEIMYRVDLYLVAFILGSAAAGAYGIVLKITEGLGRFVDAIGLVLLPIISRLNEAERNLLTRQVIIITISFSTVVAILVAVSSSVIIDFLFGENYELSVALLKIGIFSIIPLFAWKILANEFLGRGWLCMYTVSAALGSIIIVSINGIFLSSYGLTIAPIALIISYGAAALILAFFKHRKLAISSSHFIK